MEQREPIYLETHRRGLLQAKIEAAYEILSRCNLCPRNCLVDRHHGELGLCGTGDQPVVSSYSPHFGEEDPLVAARTGMIFSPTAICIVFFARTSRSATGKAGR